MCRGTKRRLRSCWGQDPTLMGLAGPNAIEFWWKLDLKLIGPVATTSATKARPNGSTITSDAASLSF